MPEAAQVAAAAAGLGRGATTDAVQFSVHGAARAALRWSGGTGDDKFSLVSMARRLALADDDPHDPTIRLLQVTPSPAAEWISNGVPTGFQQGFKGFSRGSLGLSGGRSRPPQPTPMYPRINKREPLARTGDSSSPKLSLVDPLRCVL